MATPTIPNGEEHFFPLIYEGNSAGQRIGNFVPFTDSGSIANSVIFNDGDSPKLAITPSSNGDRRTWTFSAWIKRGVLGQTAFFSWDNTSPGGGGGGDFRFDSSHRLQLVAGGGTTMNLISNRTFEDTSKYYHIYIKVDTTQSTTADRVEIYVDGDEITSFSTSTYPSQNKDFNINNTSYETRFGALNDNGSLTSYFDGYLAEVNFVDGTNPAVSTFGVTDTNSGRWIPKALTGITYGTNGFRLQFGSSSALGDDTSGNNNDLSVSNLVASDQTTDSPTQNFATGLGAFQTSYAMTMSEGNLKSAATGGSGQHGKSSSSLTFDANDSNGYYAEYTVNVTSSVGSNFNAVGITVDREAYAVPDSSNGKVSGQVRYMEDGRFRVTNLAGTLTDTTSWGSTWGDVSAPDIIGIFVKNNKIYFSKNGTYQNSANPANETGGMDIEGTIGNNRVRFSHIGYQSSSTYGTMTANFGQKSFAYTPPTGYKKLNQDNLPENSKGITGFSIIKNRDATDGFIWQDSMRGVGQYGGTAPSTAFNTASTDMIQKYLKGGFQTEDADAVNTSGESYVAHNWVLNNGTNVTDTSGDLSTELQANATAGVSVANFTVSGSGNVTWAHGLGGVPEMGMLFVYNGTPYGTTYHHSASTTPWNNYLLATSSQALATASGIWGSSKPSSTLWTGLVGSLFSAGVPYTFYSFRGIEGFSKVGAYSANNSEDGPFAYCGFRPSFLLIKSVGAISWYVIDSKRSPINPVTRGLTWDNNQVEFTNQFTIDFLSNGFKIRNSSSGSGGSTNNTSYSPYLFYAVAENPFVGDGTNPVTAR
jgi:hypothetical protein